MSDVRAFDPNRHAESHADFQRGQLLDYAGSTGFTYMIRTSSRQRQQRWAVQSPPTAPGGRPECGNPPQRGRSTVLHMHAFFPGHGGLRKQRQHDGGHERRHFRRAEQLPSKAGNPGSVWWDLTQRFRPTRSHSCTGRRNLHHSRDLKRSQGRLKCPLRSREAR